ncbi:formylmethanofuran dehydrogenase subunit E [Cytobacillus eiseniae]|uniref:Formylmethanofuran dehydrogenase subunit E n=1 Tax=Cytobacillus eiseniae TaxID=762947 RepID=A0ABS4RH06_9BACI|nr:hypothetical protein [Cytobacillus eiseniae]MBP2242180.1 formylmethanofuran dehydrogenase subunit E [Cytobacillus eiseniae]
MSELLCCERCGELTIFERMTYINNKPICSSCSENAVYALQTADSEEQ